MTPLPIVTQPEPDESWRSYLARVATLYHCTSETLGAHLGLRDTGRWPAHHGITLDSDRTRHAADILGLDPAQVTAMHLQRWDGIAIDIAALTGAAPRRWKIVPLSWTYLTHPRPCPDCLPQDGFEHLSWYLPWVTHCTRHATLLGPGDDEVRRSSSPAARTVDLLRLLNADFANFADEAVQAPTALRAWLEAAVLVAASEARTDWRTPPSAADADRWLSQASAIALADTREDAEAEVRQVIQQPSVRAGRYARANLYSPPMRDLIDSALARWGRRRPTSSR